MTRQRNRLLATLCGVLAGLGLALNDVGSTLAYLQTIPSGFQGVPRPTNLDWIAGWAGPAAALTAAGSLLGLFTHAALLGLALLVFRTLNPDFRLVAPVTPGAEAGAVLRQPIHRPRLRQIGGAALLSLWLLGYLGGWVPWPRGGLGRLLLAGPTGLPRLWPAHAAAASVVGLLLLLGGLWLVWGEAGLLRPTAGEGSRIGTGRALAGAALAGIALAPFAIPLADWAEAMATEVLQGMGGAAPDAWLTYLAGVLGVYPLALGAAGWTAMSLAQWCHFPRERHALVAGGAVSAVAWLGVAALLSIAGAGRFDDGVSLAEAAGVSQAPTGNLTTLTLLPGPRPVVGVTPLLSGQGLAATEQTGRLVWAYLQRRHFRTVHLFPALMHVCQSEALAWNSDRFLDATLRSLDRNPHPGLCQLLIEKLVHAAATPTARRALLRLQDPRRFHLPPGQMDGLFALQYRLGRDGSEVRGRLLVTGAPVGRPRVGLIDERLWQQFRGAPTALTHRLVVTSSGLQANGAFRLPRVPAGRYFLVVALPAFNQVGAPRITVQGSPGPILVRPGGRPVPVRTIHLRAGTAPGPAAPSRATARS